MSMLDQDIVQGQEDQMKKLMKLQEELIQWTSIARGFCQRTQQEAEYCGQSCCGGLTQAQRDERCAKAKAKYQNIQAEISLLKTARALLKAA